MAGVSVDVTEQIRNQEKLQESEERFRSLVQNSSDLIGVIDVQGNYKYVAESVKYVLGYDPSFFEGRNAFEFIHPEDRERTAGFLSLIEKQKYIEVPAFRFVNASGEWRWIETRITSMISDPVINGLVVNSRDITSEKNAEEALRLSEQKFRALVHNSSDIIAILDAEANFTYLSENAINFVGFTSAELEGKNAFTLIHPEDIPMVQAEFNKVLNSDESATGVAHRFLNKNGNYVWLESKGVNHFSDPHINGMIINAREITDRIKLQQALEEELANRQMMVTKAAINAQERERSQVGLELHDNVNQVLTTVKLYQELCLSGIGNREELIKKSMDLLQSSINEIRSLSKRLSAPTLGNIKLYDSIKELIEAINATGKLNISFAANSVKDYEVEAEVHLALYRILQEHLTNILKHSGADRVDVSVDLTTTQLLVQITDNGIGFDPRKKSKGIGITNMKTRAESIKGAFTLDTAPGCGCKLAVSVPLR
jgi:PAS domain S-box-containing protein